MSSYPATFIAPACFKEVACLEDFDQESLAGLLGNVDEHLANCPGDHEALRKAIRQHAAMHAANDAKRKFEPNAIDEDDLGENELGGDEIITTEPGFLDDMNPARIKRREADASSRRSKVRLRIPMGGLRVAESDAEELRRSLTTLREDAGKMQDEARRVRARVIPSTFIPDATDEA